MSYNFEIDLEHMLEILAGDVKDKLTKDTSFKEEWYDEEDCSLIKEALNIKTMELYRTNSIEACVEVITLAMLLKRCIIYENDLKEGEV